MKRLIEKPYEPVMRFFTPELFIKFNSSDDTEADRADEEWETSIRKYREFLSDLNIRMPTGLKKLAKLNLHDAEWLCLEQPTEPFVSNRFEPFPFQSGIGIVSVRKNNECISLIYNLWDQITKYGPEGNWPFSKQKLHWLYDEIDLVPSPFETFFHRILLSDGRVVKIPFISVLIHRVRLADPGAGLAPKQIA